MRHPPNRLMNFNPYLLVRKINNPKYSWYQATCCLGCEGLDQGGGQATNDADEGDEDGVDVQPVEHR